jgi:hypothetical protein
VVVRRLTSKKDKKAKLSNQLLEGAPSNAMAVAGASPRRIGLFETKLMLMREGFAKSLPFGDALHSGFS